jgi:putative FmdB family regulatory protein
MPLYEYKCSSCGDVFEVMQKVADEPLTLHENCGGRVERLLSPPALQFKGTGWYVTDYGRSSKEKPDTSKPAQKGSESDSSKGASKPQAPAVKSPSPEK